MIAATADGRADGVPRYWLLVAALLVINTYAFVDRAALALLVEPIKRDLGVSDLQMGLLLGLGFALFYGAFAIPAGHFIDRHNRRAIIGGASILWALMTLVCATADSIGQLFVGRAGVGIAESVIAPAAFSLIRDAVPLRSRGLAFSLYAMAPLLGGALSLLFGGAVLAAASAGSFNHLPVLSGMAPWQCTFALIGLCGLPLSLLLLLVPEPPRPAIEPSERKPEEGLCAGLRASLGHMGRNLHIYTPLIMFVTFGAMANFANSGWTPSTLARTWGLPPQKIGPMLGSITLPSGIGGLVFSGFVLNWLTVRGKDIRSYGLIAALGTMVGLIGIGLAPSLQFALMMAGIASFFLGTSYSVGATTLGLVTPVRLMGRVTAVYFLFQSLLGQAVGPFMVALGSQKMFSGRTALADSFALWTGIYMVAMIGAGFVLRHRVRARSSAEASAAGVAA